MELSHGGLQPWVNKDLVTVVRWKSAILEAVVDTGKTCDCVVGGHFDGHLPTLVYC